MIISGIDELSSFLSTWYGESDLSIPASAIPPDTVVPKALWDTWLKIGRLWVGYKDWVRIGTPSPLACQDGLAAPGSLYVRDGIAQVVSENQGNWAIGYEVGSKLIDPPMFSDFLEQEIRGVGFAPLGCNLSDLIITSALTETIFFGSTSLEGLEEHAARCDRTVWRSRYYNAVGHGEEYEVPSHQIRTNSQNDMLSLYWDDKFSGFLASSKESRRRLQQLL